jgi:peroxiredoxin
MNSLKPWTSRALAAAGIYELAWAAAAALRGSVIQGWMGLGPVQPEAAWLALVGAVALGGTALLIAASDPARHWLIVAISAAARAGAFAGTLFLLWQGRLPQRSLYLSAADNLPWVAVLATVLFAAHEAALGRRRCGSSEILGLALRTRTNAGVTLDELSRLSPVLLVFLRHSGCMFCREALTDLAGKRRQIEANGTRLVLVHMGSEEQGARFFAKYGLEHATRISDPRRTLYRAFGLPRATLGMFFNPKLVLRGFQAAVLGRNGFGRFTGDVFQLPGAFLLYYGELVRCYRHQNISDRPDYVALVTGHSYAAEEFSS